MGLASSSLGQIQAMTYIITVMTQPTLMDNYPQVSVREGRVFIYLPTKAHNVCKFPDASSLSPIHSSPTRSQVPNPHRIFQDRQTSSHRLLIRKLDVPNGTSRADGQRPLSHSAYTMNRRAAADCRLQSFFSGHVIGHQPRLTKRHSSPICCHLDIDAPGRYDHTSQVSCVRDAQCLAGKRDLESRELHRQHGQPSSQGCGERTGAVCVRVWKMAPFPCSTLSPF